MKCISIFIALTLFMLTSHADDFYRAEFGDPPDHLTPVNYRFDDYDKRIAEHLFATDAKFGRFIIRPSFNAETCLSVYDKVSKDDRKKRGELNAISSESDKKYWITVTQASESLWYSMADHNSESKTKKVKVTRNDREISLELAVAIQRAWGKFLHRTKYPSKASGGFDGITFQFSVFVRGLGNIHGQTWTPQNGLTAEIASLGVDLIAFVRDKRIMEKPMIESLKAFEAKIPQNQ